VARDRTGNTDAGHFFFNFHTVSVICHNLFIRHLWDIKQDYFIRHRPWDSFSTCMSAAVCFCPALYIE
jgi:hypothetical protein